MRVDGRGNIGSYTTVQVPIPGRPTHPLHQEDEEEVELMEEEEGEEQQQQHQQQQAQQQQQPEDGELMDAGEPQQDHVNVFVPPKLAVYPPLGALVGIDPGRNNLITARWVDLQGRTRRYVLLLVMVYDRMGNGWMAHPIY